MHVTAPSARRLTSSRRRTSRDLVDSGLELTEDQVKAVIERVRTGDRVAAERPAEHTAGESSAPAETIGILGNAAGVQ